MIDKLTLKSFVIVTGWIGLLALIGYAAYKDPSRVTNSFDTLLGAGLSIINIAIGKWLFGGDRGG
jgi:hypothetical protein